MLLARMLRLESPCAEEVLDVVHIRILQVFVQVTLDSFDHGYLLHLAGEITKGKPAADLPQPFEEPAEHNPLLLHMNLPLLDQLSSEVFTKLPVKPLNAYHVETSQSTFVVGCHFDVGLRLLLHCYNLVVGISCETVELVSYRVQLGSELTKLDIQLIIEPEVVASHHLLLKETIALSYFNW